MAQENNLKPIVREKDDIVEQQLIEKGYKFPMASHHVSEQKVWDFFMALFNGNERAAAGACGNMMHESGLYSDNAENSWEHLTGHTDEWLTQGINDGSISLSQFLQKSWYVNKYGFGYGLSQWTDETRRTLLWNRTKGQGLDIDDEDAQLAYINWEFTSPDSYYSQFRQGMIDCTTISQATHYYLDNYEVGAWNDDRLTYANYFYETYGSSSGMVVILSVIGNGTASVSDYTPQPYDTITLTCTPATGETLIDIDAREISTGYSIAVQLITGSQPIPLQDKSISITVTFSGETPPTPPEPPVPPLKQNYLQNNMPIWMYPCFRKC